MSILNQDAYKVTVSTSVFGLNLYIPTNSSVVGLYNLPVLTHFKYNLPYFP